MRLVFNAVALFVLTIFWSSVAILGFWISPRRVTYAVGRIWGRQVLAVTGVEVVVTGAEGLDLSRGYLLVANHTSHYDAIALYGYLPVPTRFVAKHTLGYIPIFGWVLSMGAAVMIDRRDRKRAVASIARASRDLAAGGTIAFFPEGTRTEEGILGPLKKGAFHLATATGAPILPVGVRGAGRVLPVGDWRVRGGRIHLALGDPIETEGYPDDDEGRQALSKAVSEALRSLMGAQTS